MPSLRNHRQAGPAAWFDAPAGQCLLQAEHATLARALVARPAQQSWLWLAPLSAASKPLQLPPGGLRLHPGLAGWDGDVRCRLPLPLADESIANILLQHVVQATHDPLLGECARVLEPGGRLWLHTFNPWSPYRLRWARNGLRTPSPLGLLGQLRALGLTACEASGSRLGPVWKVQTSDQGASPEALRAVLVLQMEKRTASLIPPAPVKARWQPGAAPA